MWVTVQFVFDSSVVQIHCHLDRRTTQRTAVPQSCHGFRACGAESGVAPTLHQIVLMCSNMLFWTVRYIPYRRLTPCQTHRLWCAQSRLWKSCIFQPCKVVLQIPVLHFPVLHFQRPHRRHDTRPWLQLQDCIFNFYLLPGSLNFNI